MYDDFLPSLYIAAVFVSHWLCRSLSCVYLVLLCVPVAYIFNVWLRLALYCDHVHSHDFVWLLLVACTILLYYRIHTVGWKPYANRGPVCAAYSTRLCAGSQSTLVSEPSRSGGGGEIVVLLGRRARDAPTSPLLTQLNVPLTAVIFFPFGSAAQFRPWPPPWNFPFHLSY
jgi:hypothetical protein